jgi:hypothetical protein
MTAPGWPEKAREAVALAISEADQEVPPGWDGWLQEADAAIKALTPFVAALVAAGQEAVREACASEAWTRWNDQAAEVSPDYIADAIREMPLPSAPEALAAIRAEARREGMLAAAAALERRARSCRPNPAYEAKEPLHYEQCVAVADELESQATAIRAAAEEPKT